ncbi:DUF2335 domain-containing protein [Companilactobacillus muriivasis]|uniref:DUF2335 domain-containing protein n=1 Tax=Companilactobacillus muriivasis TaxID=3081444 RepID=UPI0030C6F66B
MNHNEDIKELDKVNESESNNEVDETVSHIERLAPKQKEQVISKLEMYSGPIPHPDILKKYDEMYHGAAREIIDNGVQESVHRRSMESSYLSQNVKRKRRRDWMGFTIGIVVLFLGFYLIYLGHTIVGTIFSSGFGVTLVAVFASDGNSAPSNKSSDSENKSN